MYVQQNNKILSFEKYAWILCRRNRHHFISKIPNGKLLSFGSKFLIILLISPLVLLSSVTGLSLWGSIVSVGIVVTFYTSLVSLHRSSYPTFLI